jgi:AcrR family transcriptional regulator
MISRWRAWVVVGSFSVAMQAMWSRLHLWQRTVSQLESTPLMSTEDAAPRTRRADATLNRERLLAAAIEAFATGDESQTTYKAIAARAGVGIATMHRNFPTREALVEAAYRDELASLEARAGELLATHSPDVALRLWFDRMAAYVTTKRGMAETIRAIVDAGIIARADVFDGLTSAVAEILDAGVVAGVLQEGVDSADVVTMLAGIFLATELYPEPARIGRLLDLLLASLRP